MDKVGSKMSFIIKEIFLHFDKSSFNGIKNVVTESNFFQSRLLVKEFFFGREVEFIKVNFINESLDHE